MEATLHSWIANSLTQTGLNAFKRNGMSSSVFPYHSPWWDGLDKCWVTGVSMLPLMLPKLKTHSPQVYIMSGLDGMLLTHTLTSCSCSTRVLCSQLWLSWPEVWWSITTRTIRCTLPSELFKLPPPCSTWYLMPLKSSMILSTQSTYSQGTQWTNMWPFFSELHGTYSDQKNSRELKFWYTFNN